MDGILMDGSMMMLMMAGVVLGALLFLAVLIFGLFALVKYLRRPE
jgi:hypothetical protein